MYDAYCKSKNMTRKQRHIHEANSNLSTILVSFNLENVFALPRTSVPSAFYCRKLNTYNLTARVNRKWATALYGMKPSVADAAKTASVVSVLLREILKDHPENGDLVLSSDSCVSQNRKSHMSYALQIILQSAPALKSIDQQFFEPEHRPITDVDISTASLNANFK